MRNKYIWLGLFVILIPFFNIEVAKAATFVVDTTADTVDANIGNGTCADASGNCSLRAAIQEANGLGGADVINFNISTGDSGYVTGTPNYWLFQPSTPFPAITQQVTIDATTQSGYVDRPIIMIDGTTAGSSGFYVNTDDCIVRGFVIANFPIGISIGGGR